MDPKSQCKKDVNSLMVNCRSNVISTGLTSAPQTNLKICTKHKGIGVTFCTIYIYMKVYKQANKHLCA
jgi:hypothetical protein